MNKLFTFVYALMSYRLQAYAVDKRRLRSYNRILSRRIIKQTQWRSVRAICEAWIACLKRATIVVDHPDFVLSELEEKSTALTVELVDLRDWVDALQKEVDDATANLSALHMERGDINDELEALDKAFLVLQTRKDSLNEELRRLKDECLAILILAEAGGTEYTHDNSFQELVSLTDELNEKRQKLLEDIELQYGRANGIADDCGAKSDQIFVFTREILEDSQRDKSAVAALEIAISGLNSDRKLLEQSLSDCQSSLEGCQSSLTERSRSVQIELETMAKDEAALLLECDALDSEESALKDELEKINRIALEYNRVEAQIIAELETNDSIRAADVLGDSKVLVSRLEREVHSSRIGAANFLSRGRGTDSLSSDGGLIGPQGMNQSRMPSESDEGSDVEEIRRLSAKIRNCLESTVTI